MVRRNMGILCAVCLAAAGGAWGWNGRLPGAGARDIFQLLSLQKIDVADVFQAADTNHDQRLTFEEAHNYNFLVTQDMFDDYDLDLNGYVDRTEAGLPAADIEVKDIFEDADANGDEKLTFDEAYANCNLITAAQFYGLDANLDGYVDRTEAGLPPDSGKDGCEGCNGGKSRPAGGDLFTMALSLLGLAVMAGIGRR